MGWLESAAAEVLQKSLGAFVRGIDASGLELDVGRGDIRLHNLELRTEALASFNLPLTILGANLGELHVVVPWRNLGKEPLTVHISKLFIIAVPQTEAYADDAAFRSMKDKEDAARREQLAAWEVIQEKRVASSQYIGGASVINKLVNGLLQKLQVTVNNVHIRVLSNAAGVGPAAGLVIESIGLTDAGMHETLPDGISMQQAVELLMRKTLSLVNCMLYIDHSPGASKKSGGLVVPRSSSEWDEVMGEAVARAERTQPVLDKLSCVLHVSADTMSEQPVR